jgi:hypothetical protein
MSEANEALYRTFVSPWVRMVATPWTAELLKWLHPMRTSRYLLSESFNPWMVGLNMLAGAITKNRHPLAPDQWLIAKERKNVADTTEVLQGMRKVRDAMYEQAFGILFESSRGRV